MMFTRGERNNNPGNIENTPGIEWQGQLPHDPSVEPRFARFETRHHGLRALARNLLAYYRTHGLDTVMGIVNRWAPPGENNTGAYVQHVANLMGVRVQDPLKVDDPAILGRLTRAIVTHENGRCIYTDVEIAAAVADALDQPAVAAAPPAPEPPPAPLEPESNWLRQKLTPQEYAAVVRWMRAEAQRLAAVRLQLAIRGASRSWTVRLNALAGAIALAWPHVEPWVSRYLGADAVAFLVALYAAANVALRAKTDKPLTER